MNTQTYKFDEFRLAPKQRKLLYRNSPVSLSSKAFEILLMLIEQRGKIIEKDEFLEKIWSDSFVEESNLVVHISALRRILLEKKGERKFIETVSGRGYSFVAPVEEIKSVELNHNEPASDRTKIPASLEEKNSPITSIAVLPFAVENQNDDLEYLANGVSQSLIDYLSQIPDLKVMAYSAVSGYKSQTPDFQEIGFLLGVDHILGGHISEYKNRLDIRVELIAAKDKRHLWGFNYECKFNDIFQIKKKISIAIAQKLQLKLTASDKNNMSREQATNSEAYKIYLKGKYILDWLSTRQNREESLYQALDFFRQALKLDADLALAYTGIGNVYNYLFHSNFLTREKSLIESRKALQLALKTDKNLSETYLLKGKLELTFDRDVSAARDSFQQAIKLNPNNAFAYHWQSLTFLCYAEFDEAIMLQNKALDFDPVSVIANYGLAKIFYSKGDYGKSIIQSEETLDINSRHISSFFLMAHSYSQLGMHEEAISNALHAFEMQPLKEVALALAYIYAKAGDIKPARKYLNDTLKSSANEALDFTDVAAVHVALKDRKKAFDYLKKAYEEGSANICGLRIDPRFAELCGEPQFNVLLEKLKLI